VDIPENGLLVPTDRDRDELEGKWLHHLGRLKVHSELKLQGYSLYSLRTWYVPLASRCTVIVLMKGTCQEHIGHRL